MSTSIVAKRYAKGVLRVAKDQNNQIDWKKVQLALDDLLVVSQLFEIESSRKILKSPVMSLGLKKSLLNYGLSQGSNDSLAVRTVSLLADAGRIQLIPELARCLQGFLDQNRGVLLGTIKAVAPLDQGVVSTVEAHLKKIFGCEVETKTEIDPSILGGMVVKVGNKVIDLSVKSEIEKLFAKIVAV